MEPQAWYHLSEDRALEMEKRGFKIRLKGDDKWLVRCGRSDLEQSERDKRGMKH